jgi:hypothetical protein
MRYRLLLLMTIGFLKIRPEESLSDNNGKIREYGKNLIQTFCKMSGLTISVTQQFNETRVAIFLS